MNIAMIGHKQIETKEGGIEKTVYDLSCAFLQRGDQVTVYDRGIKRNKPAKEASMPTGIRIIHVPTFQGAAEVPVYSLFSAIHAAFQRFDLIMFHASGPCVMIPITKAFGKKTIAFIHGIDSQRSKWGKFASWYLRIGERRAAKKADQLLVLSEPMQQHFLNTYGRESILVHNGIKKDHTEKKSLEKDEKVLSSFDIRKDSYFFWTGRISKEKGLQYLIPAFLHCESDKKLVLAGRISSQKNSYYKELLQICQDDERVLFIDSQPADILNVLYRNAFAFVFPSELEGMAHSLLEAQAAGAACILSDIPENRDVAKEHALYFQSRNEVELEMIMKDLLAHPEKRDIITFGQIDDILRDYSLEGSTEQIIDICRETVEK